METVADVGIEHLEVGDAEPAITEFRIELEIEVAKDRSFESHACPPQQEARVAIFKGVVVEEGSGVRLDEAADS